jgi:Kef-type K+ transport system membrane component KefB
VNVLAPVVLALAVILAAAKLGGDVAERIGQPAVLGELVVGVLVGNLSLVGIDWFEFIAINDTIGVLAQLGAVILVFEVGLTLVVRGEHIIDAATYSAVVIIVMLTTLITPPALKWSLNKRR